MGTYVINLDEFKSIENHWTVLYVSGNNKKTSYDAVYFDVFGAELIPKEIKKFLGNKNIITNIYRIQPYDSIISGYLCIGFIDFMLKGRSLLEYTDFLLMIWRRMIKLIKYFH